MTIFKCKMCGGTLEFNPGDTVAVCDSCGTKQTLPKLDDDRRANLYDRANHFRRSNEYDKAMGIYEQILAEDNTDAEAYWSLVLCRYGIEYVEDPATHRRVPTVNRAQFTSIFDDDNYKSALHYADAAQREVYESEAKAINEIQKGILVISQKEQPFDVFICYKETDASGRRTPDSVLANDLYHQLTQEGFKVFFARITLEDKLGTAYEPYIFAALNSAKVMVVLGTKPEYFNAVWVKNEWSRYLALVKNSGGKKMLIPAYKDMDPYDLPEEFSHLQAQDMGKLGFMQDLIRGIKKIISADAPKAAAKETVVVSGGNAAVEPLLKRAFMFLEDGNWQEADTYCEKVLDQDPENAQAYLGKLMAELQVHTQEGLIDCKMPFDSSDNYRKAIRFGDESLQQMLTSTVDSINARNEENRRAGIYQNAQDKLAAAQAEDDYTAAALLFESISEYRDAAALGEECRDKAETARKDAILAAGNAALEKAKRISDYESALERFASIPGWKNADENAALCQRKIDEIRLETERKKEEHRIAAEAAKKKAKKIAIIVGPIVCVCIAFVIVLNTVIIPKQKCNKALDMIESGDYEAGYAILKELGENGAIQSNRYDRAIKLADSGDYQTAYVLLDGLSYKDSAEKLQSIRSLLLSKAIPGDTVSFGKYEQDYDTSNGKEDIKWLVLDKKDDAVLVISKHVLEDKSFGRNDDTWETCSLRKWLNGDFINDAFSPEEQSKLQITNVSADKNPKFDVDSGNATMDNIFLLSAPEAEKYFASDEARKADLYSSVSNMYRYDGWWLRTPGAALGADGKTYQRFGSMYVGSIGAISLSGNSGGATNGVRPAMWISLK